jgi:L-fuculose-phosphate aldolase
MSRLERLESDLARTIRRLYERGLVSGVGGNASVILPSRRKEILITPTGYFKGGVAEGDLLRVSLKKEEEGEKKQSIIGKGRPSSELPTHLAAYRVRKDVEAVVHGHPPTAVALVTAGVAVPTMTPEHAVMIKSLEVVGFAVPGEAGARAIEDSLKRCDVVGIVNHGFFSLGPDLHEAASRLEVLEESAKIYLAARQAAGGEGKEGVFGLREEEIKRIREAYSR